MKCIFCLHSFKKMVPIDYDYSIDCPKCSASWMVDSQGNVIYIINGPDEEELFET